MPWVSFSNTPLRPDACSPKIQAYLYDTLPIILAEHELCPGDLIFTQGRYYDENKARPKHDIVHVEIFVGGSTGKGSLGSLDCQKSLAIYTLTLHRHKN